MNAASSVPVYAPTRLVHKISRLKLRPASESNTGSRMSETEVISAREINATFMAPEVREPDDSVLVSTGTIEPSTVRPLLHGERFSLSPCLHRYESGRGAAPRLGRIVRADDSQWWGWRHCLPRSLLPGTLAARKTCA